MVKRKINKLVWGVLSHEKSLDYTGITVVYFCHDWEGNFLMNKRSIACRDEHGMWDLGGGSLEYGHTIKETLHREIREECCTNVINYEFLGYRDMHRVHEIQRTHWVALDFKVQVDRSKVKNGEPHKFDGLGWFTLNYLPDNLHS